MSDRKSVIIGINWEQNSTAALMISGKIAGCVSEERFSRIKNDERYPIKSINWLLYSNGLTKKDVTDVCFISKDWSPTYSLVRHYTNFTIKDYLEEQQRIWYPRLYLKKKVSFLSTFKKKIDFNQFPGKAFWKRVTKNMGDENDHNSNEKIKKLGKKIRSEVIQKHLGIQSSRIHFVDHSSGHAFYAYFSSRNINKKKLVITLDAWGDNINYSAKIFRKINQKIEVKNIVSGPNFIIGRLYRYVTLILGLKPNEHEYKVMGLAPYCKDQYYQKVLKTFLNFQDIKNYKFIFLKKPKDFYFDIKKKLDGERFDSIAGGLQKYTEILISKWIAKLVSNFKVYDLCLAGGVGMNVKNNLIIGNLKKVKNLFIPPSPDDSSQAMGACYSHYIKKYNKIPKPLENAYLGYKINEKDVKKLIKKIDRKKFLISNKNIISETVKLLRSEKIIARCVGKGEFGARSLGNRSILADPSNQNIKKIINEKVKNRDFWMPFAASVLKDHAKKYFVIKSRTENYNYMTNCLETTPMGRKKLSAAIHPYDYTCRPQIIEKGQNKEFEKIISEFGRFSGVYALLNTSFNLHGFPIVNDVEDAWNVFLKTNIDGLLLENYLILKKST